MTDRPRILIIDDELDMTYLFASLLSRAGYKVECAGDAASALLKLESNSFDLLITDLSLPDMNGLELLRRVRGIDEDVPVIVFTGRDAPGPALLAAGLRVNCYLRKGTTSGPELIEAIDHALSDSPPD